MLRGLVQADGVTVAPTAPVMSGPVLPEMSPGATDGLFTRNAGIPTYGIDAFHQSMEFWYRLTKRLAE